MTAWLCSLFSLVQFKMVSMCLEKPVQFKMVSMRSEKPVQFSSRWYSCTQKSLFSSRWYPCAQKSLFSSVQDGIHALRKAHMLSTPSLRSFHNVTFGLAPRFVGFGSAQPGLLSDCEEVKQDAERCNAFSRICFTLSKLAGTQMQLPDTAQLLDMFGKVGQLYLTWSLLKENTVVGHVWKGRSVVHCMTPFRTEYSCWTCLKR